MTNPKAPKLLPCPFCGSDAVLTGSLIEPPLNHVICTKCPVGTRGFMNRRAVKFWNTRQPPKLIERDVLDDDGLSGMWKARALRYAAALEKLESYCFGLETQTRGFRPKVIRDLFALIDPTAKQDKPQ